MICTSKSLSNFWGAYQKTIRFSISTHTWVYCFKKMRALQAENSRLFISLISFSQCLKFPHVFLF